MNKLLKWTLALLGVFVLMIVAFGGGSGHLFRHEDSGMMGQFVVVEPGDEAGSVSGHHDH